MIRRFQVERITLDEVTLRLECDPGFDDSLEAKLLAEVEKSWVTKTHLRVEHVDSIPLTRAGKLRVVRESSLFKRSWASNGDQRVCMSQLSPQPPAHKRTWCSPSSYGGAESPGQVLMLSSSSYPTTWESARGRHREGGDDTLLERFVERLRIAAIGNSIFQRGWYHVQWRTHWSIECFGPPAIEDAAVQAAVVERLLSPRPRSF